MAVLMKSGQEGSTRLLVQAAWSVVGRLLQYRGASRGRWFSGARAEALYQEKLEAEPHATCKWQFELPPAVRGELVRLGLVDGGRSVPLAEGPGRRPSRSTGLAGQR